MKRVWSFAIGAAVFIVLFQLFFRYTYVKQNYAVLRIDRVTQASCYMPCTPSPAPTPKPVATFEDVASGNSEAIQLVKNQADARSIQDENPTPRYEWTVEHELTNGDAEDFAVARFAYLTGDKDYPVHFPIREVCYCDKKRSGWRWEVNLDARSIYRVDGNVELERRYGISPTVPR